jgi:flagellin-like hook-associated protein FlgL
VLNGKKTPAEGRKTKTPRKGKSTMALSTINLTAGMRANLFSLQQTSKELEITQKRLATGLKVNTALDDPIAFFASEAHRQRASDLTMRKDEMGEAIQTVKAANNGIESISTLIESAKSLAQSALSAATSAELTSLETQYNNVLDQLDLLVEDSGYKGINLLGGTSETLNVKFDENGDSSITLTGFDASATGLLITDASGWNGGGGAADTAAVNANIAELDVAKTTLRTESKNLASNLNVITTREDFTSSMINTLSDGAAKLTEADMNEEGANMLMLQTRQALGTTSLSMASQAAQSVLRLF